MALIWEVRLEGGYADVGKRCEMRVRGAVTFDSLATFAAHQATPQYLFRNTNSTVSIPRPEGSPQEGIQHASLYFMSLTCEPPATALALRYQPARSSLATLVITT